MSFGPSIVSFCSCWTRSLNQRASSGEKRLPRRKAENRAHSRIRIESVFSCGKKPTLKNLTTELHIGCCLDHRAFHRYHRVCLDSLECYPFIFPCCPLAVRFRSAIVAIFLKRRMWGQSLFSRVWAFWCFCRASQIYPLDFSESFVYKKSNFISWFLSNNQWGIPMEKHLKMCLPSS